MSAIGGLWRFDDRPDASLGCARILDALAGYGPDASGQWSNHAIALGRGLARVLPEDAFDTQPLIGGGDRFVLVADLRLDNRDDLTRALQISPRDAANLSDAAILMAGIERWGDSCVEKIVGDYAFALWDRAQQRLTLARDAIGYRPLHFHRGENFFAFASMPKGLHALPDVPYAADEERVAEFLVQLPEAGPRTFFRGIERVEPGCIVTVQNGKVISRRHWNPQPRSIRLKADQDYVEAARALLDEAVRCRLRSTGEVGAHLSGGFDSSGVAATAARLLAATGKRLAAFTSVPRSGYDGPVPAGRIGNEESLAAETAAMYPNIDHVLVADPGRSPLDDLDRSFALLDRPIINLAGSWGSAINDTARARGTKVMLLGSFGNMGLSYGGMALLPELFRTGRWGELWRNARDLRVHQNMTALNTVARIVGPWFPASLWMWVHKVRHGINYDVSAYSPINPKRFIELGLSARAKATGSNFVARPYGDAFEERLWHIRWADQGNPHAATIAGWQFDRRDPTADVRLLEFCLGIPTEQFLYGGILRSLARRVLADRLPSAVLDETRRGQQGVDWHERLTAVRARVAQLLDAFDSCPSAVRTLDLPRLHRLVDNWPSSGWERDDVIDDYRYVLLGGVGIGYFLWRVNQGAR